MKNKIACKEMLDEARLSLALSPKLKMFMQAILD